MKPSKSGSLPAARSASIWLSSPSMSFIRAMSSGDMSAMAPDIWSTACCMSCSRSLSTSASKRSLASADVKSYCSSPLTLPARSDGSISSSMCFMEADCDVSSSRRASPDACASDTCWSSAARSRSTTSLSSSLISPNTPPRSNRSSRSWRRSRSWSSISRRPAMRSPLRSSNPSRSRRRRALFRSPWYRRSSVSWPMTSNASTSKPTCVPSHGEYRNRGRAMRAAPAVLLASDP